MATVLNIQFKEIDDDIVERDRLFNVFLLGLPRSGTSLTTNILQKLGVNMIHTSEFEDKKKATDERFEKKYGDYHANPEGFFEITEDQFTYMMKIFQQPYSGCKMIIPVQGFRWEILRKYPCKVVFMSRDVEEIRQSQMAYYKPSGVDVAYLRSALATQRVRLREHKIDFLEVNYNELLKKPRPIIEGIAEFINTDVYIDEAVALVDPDKNRFKSEELIPGI